MILWHKIFVLQVFDQGENRSISIFIAVVFLPMLVLCSIRDLKSLAIISTLANVLFVVGFAITFFYIFSTFNEKDPKPLPNFSSWSSLPLFFGTAMFAFEAISLVSKIYLYRLRFVAFVKSFWTFLRRSYQSKIK